MANKLYEENDIQNIANAIRTKNGSSDTYKVSDMADAVINLPSGGGAELNIFVQTTEPENKNGIWLQANREVEHIYADEDIFIAGTWEPDGKYAQIPYNFSGGVAVTIGTDVYLFGSSSSPYRMIAYKYNTLTDTYTQLANMSYQFYYGSVVAIGTDIYLVGGYNSSRMVKYDTLTNTYTLLSSISYGFSYGSAVAIGTDIYLFGGDSSGNYRKAYKYNTLTDTYTQLTNIPYDFRHGSAVAIGNYIYLFGSYNSSNACRYNTVTNTYTLISNVPYTFYDGTAIGVGTDVYIFGSSNQAYKYNTLTDTYTQLTDSQYGLYSAKAVVVGTKAYLFGGSTDTKVQCMNLTSKQYETNSVIIAQGRYNAVGYEVKLFTDDMFEMPLLYAFADAWFYTNDIETNIPTYYGNGTSWTKIKN